MTRRQKRLTYVILAALMLALFAGGVVYGYSGRSNTICKDGKPPLQENDYVGIGQVAYRCHNGQIVTNS